MGVLGAKGALSGEVECARRELRSPGLGFHVSGSRRRAEQVWGEAPCGALLLHRVREGTWGWQFAPGSGSAMTLRIVLLGLLQPPPPTPSLRHRFCTGAPELLGLALATAVLEETSAGTWADGQVAFPPSPPPRAPGVPRALWE